MTAQKILIMGLPGAGKTYFAERLKKYLEDNSNIYTMPLWRQSTLEIPPQTYSSKVDWFNADEIRRKYNDWDFSREGRIRQSLRMFDFALRCTEDFVICDFVAPLVEMRNNFKADWTVWIDTISFWSLNFFREMREMSRRSSSRRTMVLMCDSMTSS